MAATALNYKRLMAFGKNGDVFMAFAVVGILLLMIFPLQPFLLDLALSLSISCSLVILMVAAYISRPLDLSAFPSILLLVTLLRLSLNVASTRVILINGGEGAAAAGKVIHAFGNFVVGGNYVVGLIVFVILVVINFVVITKGAGRIAEVAARFTLDAMPGKQMSIDADLNAGLIDDEEARQRRQHIAQEAEYYGAMDGASKFVRGDAIAGIIITLINIVGGFAVGVFQLGMGFGEAAETFTLLTVGDGLVSQIPALIVSTAAGIIVSRAGASESNLGKEIAAQIFLQPRAIAASAGVLLTLGLIPGLPCIPFLFFAAVAGAVAYALHQARQTGEQQAQEAAARREKTEAPQRVDSPPPLDLLALEIGYALVPLVDVNQNAELLDRIRSIRRQIAQEIGIVVPPVHIQDNMTLKPGEYTILLKGNEIARGELIMNHFLAMNPGMAKEKIEGITTKEPTYGLPALWIKPENRERAMGKGYTVVDPATVMVTHLSHVIRTHAYEILGRQEVQTLLDRFKESYPKVVEELIPNQLSLGAVGKVLQNLLREQIPIRDLLTILETLADWSPGIKDVEILTEYVRQAMSRTITRMYEASDGSLPVLTLDQAVEKTLVGAVQRNEQGTYMNIDPVTAERIVQSISGNFERFGLMNHQPVVLCSAHIRAHFKRLLDRFTPNITVLSYNEILNNVKVKSLGTVGLGNAN